MAFVSTWNNVYYFKTKIKYKEFSYCNTFTTHCFNIRFERVFVKLFLTFSRIFIAHLYVKLYIQLYIVYKYFDMYFIQFVSMVTCQVNEFWKTIYHWIHIFQLKMKYFFFSIFKLFIIFIVYLNIEWCYFSLGNCNIFNKLWS